MIQHFTGYMHPGVMLTHQPHQVQQLSDHLHLEQQLPDHLHLEQQLADHLHLEQQLPDHLHLEQQLADHLHLEQQLPGHLHLGRFFVTFTLFLYVENVNWEWDSWGRCGGKVYHTHYSRLKTSTWVGESVCYAILYPTPPTSLRCPANQSFHECCTAYRL